MAGEMSLSEKEGVFQNIFWLDQHYSFYLQLSYTLSEQLNRASWLTHRDGNTSKPST